MSRVIIVNTAGPQGAVGPQGLQGPIGPSGSVDTGSFATTGSNTFIGSQSIYEGSLFVEGGVSTDGNLSATNIYGNFYGNLYGTASTATSSSRALSAVSSSYATSASFAATASAVNTIGTNAGAANHIVFTNISSTNTNTLYTDAGGNLQFNPGTNVLSATNIVATTITGSLLGTSSWAQTASHAITAGTANAVNQLNQNVTIVGNLNVFGTASYTYTTASQLDVGASYISVNVAEPGERFGGLKVYDSGSLSHLATSSLSWDSLNNKWIYQNASGSTYSGGMLISGPRNTGSMGNEQGTTTNALMKGQGGDHITSSGIFEDSSGNVGIGINTPTARLDVSGSVRTMDLVPAANNTYTLGAFGNVWATLWVQNGTLNQLYTGTIRSNNTGGVRVASNNSNTWAQWFDGTGNLLLQNGGTFADAGYKLDVSGSARITDNLTVTGSVTATSFTGSLRGTVTAPGSDGQMLFNSKGFIGVASSVYYKTSGRLGINTDSPAGRLGISGSSSDILLKLNSDTYSDVLVVSGSGNVGIGTSSPGYRLDVVGDTILV
jgi:hypothetical protein